MILTGQIVYGKQLGRTLGFPTANLAPETESAPVEMPENGVYAGWIYLEGGVRLPCVINQGRHPTVPEGAPTIEAHVLDFSGDLYGQTVSVEYLKFIRPEVKFASLDELKAQIARDSELAREYCRQLQE